MRSKTVLLLKLLCKFSPGKYNPRMDEICDDRTCSEWSPQAQYKLDCEKKCSIASFYKDNCGSEVSILSHTYYANNNFIHGHNYRHKYYGTGRKWVAIITHKSVAPIILAYNRLSIAEFNKLYDLIIDMTLSKVRKYIKTTYCDDRINYLNRKEKMLIEALEKFLPGGHEKKLDYPDCGKGCHKVSESCLPWPGCERIKAYNKARVSIRTKNYYGLSFGKLRFKHGFDVPNLNLPLTAKPLVTLFKTYTTKEFEKFMNIIMTMENITIVNTYLVLKNGHAGE